MNKEKQHNKLVPELRFPEFKENEEWIYATIDGISLIASGGTPSRSKPQYWNGDIPWISTTLINYNKIKTANEFITELGLNNSSTKVFPKGTILMAMYGQGKTRGKVAVLDINAAINQACAAISLKKGMNIEFVFQNLSARYEEIRKISNEGGQKNLSSALIKKIPFFYPKIESKEQQKIANCLSSLDNLIGAATEKLEYLKDHKKGLLQQLFPANGETVPQVRFPEFVGDGDWEKEPLEDSLDYLQPTPYLVSNTDYKDEFETPVLTAGKTFILGYTDEKEGIFIDKLPVIIFDDFTTATKYVDFPFKGKSSAMKILLAKDDNNIKFIFEAIQNLTFEVGTHKRHWISVYSKLNILKPTNPKEQQKIADCFSSLDNLIEAQTEKIEGLKEHKKGLMQQLFPNTNHH